MPLCFSFVSFFEDCLLKGGGIECILMIFLDIKKQHDSVRFFSRDDNCGLSYCTKEVVTFNF